MTIAIKENVQPLHDKLIVKPDDSPDVTPGGIFLPDDARERAYQGTVISVGPGRTLENGTKIPMNVNEGDRVLYGDWTATEIEIDGERVLILKESDIIGILV